MPTMTDGVPLIDSMRECIELASYAYLMKGREAVLQAVDAFNMFCEHAGEVYLSEETARHFDEVFVMMQDFMQATICLPKGGWTVQ